MPNYCVRKRLKYGTKKEIFNGINLEISCKDINSTVDIGVCELELEVQHNNRKGR